MPTDTTSRAISVTRGVLIGVCEGRISAENYSTASCSFRAPRTGPRGMASAAILPRMSPQSAAAPLSSEVQKFDALAHEFWDPRGAFHPLHALNPVRLDYIAQRTELSQRRLADIGCGGGLLAEGLARHGAQVCGIDLAPAMIEVARLHAHASGLPIDYRLCSAEELARS